MRGPPHVMHAARCGARTGAATQCSSRPRYVQPPLSMPASSCSCGRTLPPQHGASARTPHTVPFLWDIVEVAWSTQALQQQGSTGAAAVGGWQARTKSTQALSKPRLLARAGGREWGSARVELRHDVHKRLLRDVGLAAHCVQRRHHFLQLICLGGERAVLQGSPLPRPLSYVWQVRQVGQAPAAAAARQHVAGSCRNDERRSCAERAPTRVHAERAYASAPYSAGCPAVDISAGRGLRQRHWPDVAAWARR